jgi:putative endonuclease
MMDSDATKPPSSFRTGLSAEDAACAYLTAQGFRILARRWRSRLGEIDIVARRAALLIFVEVKARGRIDDAAYAVTARQQKRIAGAAGAWLAAHPQDAQCDMRFDAILIAPRSPPRHIAGAFEAE